MKKKTKRTLIVLLCIVAFIVAAGFAAYNIGIDYAQKKLVSSVVESMIDKGEISLADLQAMAEDAEPSEEVAPEISSNPVEAEKAGSEKAPEKKPEPQKKEEQKPEETKEEAVDKFTEKLINSISRKEKLAMVRLITSRLSSGDISYLASLLAGGLTRDERAAAEKLAKQRFSASELDLVSNYYHSYKSQIMIEPDLVPKK